MGPSFCSSPVSTHPRAPPLTPGSLPRAGCDRWVEKASLVPGGTSSDHEGLG